MELPDELIGQLAAIDTPTISNAIEPLKLRDRTSGFCDRNMRCLFPELGSMCGYAVTAQVETISANLGGLDEVFVELCRAMQASSQPAVIVFQEISAHKELSAHCGEVMATTFKRLGGIGVVTDSAVRDVNEVRRLGLHYFAPGLVASHANFRLVRVQVPVTVCGLAVEPGDLLHGDANGLLKVPLEAVERLPELVRAVQSQEAALMNYIKADEFTVDGLGKRIIH